MTDEATPEPLTVTAWLAASEPERRAARDAAVGARGGDVARG
jgi:hypothetical protein